jgi:hypothetical protein
MARRWATAATLVLAGSALGCCGATATPTPAFEPTPVPTVEPVAGRIAIQVVTVDAVSVAVRYRDAQILFDAAADQAAKEDGHPGGAPNPVWIRDLPTGGTLPIDADASVTLNGWDGAGNRVSKAATVDVFVRVFTALTPDSAWDRSPYLFVVVEGGRISSIEQPMLP